MRCAPRRAGPCSFTCGWIFGAAMCLNLAAAGEATCPLGGADAGSSADLFHDPLEGIVGPDLDPVAVRRGSRPRLADAFLDQFGRSGHPLASQLAVTVSALSWAASRLWADGLTCGHLAHVGRGLVAEYIGRNATSSAATVRGKCSATLSTRPRQASEMISRTFERPRSTKWRRKADQPDLSSLAPSQMPTILPVALRV